MAQIGFWDWEERQAKLAERKPLLVHLNQIIPWEDFRPILIQIYEKERKSKAGRKPLDVVMMFKLLILQQLYNISDAELEFQVNDRLSFMRFVGLGLGDRIPDEKTMWLFRERLKESRLVESLFVQFDDYLRQSGYEAKGGQIVDATLVPVPKQRNSKEENEQVKRGETPPEWEKQPRKLRQKDRDARWTKKNGQNYFGYKNHIEVDREYKLIREYQVTNAAVHDSQMLEELLDEYNEGDDVWGDSAYRSEEKEEALKQMGYNSQIHERGKRNQPLGEKQRERNKEKSKVRVRVEHTFGAMVNEMGSKLIRVIGENRAKVCIGLKNLAYNVKRYEYLVRQRRIGEALQEAQG